MTNRLHDRLRKLEGNRPQTYGRVRQRFVHPDGRMEGDLPPDHPDALTIEIVWVAAKDGRRVVRN